MDAFEAVATKLEVREYDPKKPVPKGRKIESSRGGQIDCKRDEHPALAA